MLSVVIEPQQLEAALAAGRVGCPGCGGRLSGWGYARERAIRLHGAEVRSLRPRRAVCGQCHATHVLLAAWSVPRRRDASEVIGQALVLASQGVGHRVIARRLGRAPGTVRGWLRAARRRAKSLRECGTLMAVALDPELEPILPGDSELGDAVEALAVAARAWTLRFGPASSGTWPRVVAFTGGLLCGVPPPPP